MKCIKCGQEMIADDFGSYRCPDCGRVTKERPLSLDKVAWTTNCLICGAEMVTNSVGAFLRESMVCDDCKKAIAWAKEKMKE